MIRSFTLSALALAVCAQALASEVTPGSTLTTGPTSNGHSLYSATFNPAVAALTVDSDEKLRFSYFPSISFSTELGDVNDFVDDIDDLIDILDDPSLTDESVEETLDRFNSVVEQMGDEGYVTVSAMVTAPIFPIYWQPDFLPGTVFSELAASIQVKTSFLDDELTYDDAKQTFSTASSAYVKSGIQTKFALGYAQELFNEEKFADYGGRLYAGVKANFYRLELSKQVILLEELEGEDIEDYVSDAYDNNVETATKLGLDLGLTWVADRYRAGLTLNNINSPSFEYGAIGVDCSQYADGSFDRANCEATDYFVRKGDIKSHEKHTKHFNATVDSTVYLLKNWSLSGSVDLAAYDDTVGTENQWLNVASAYNTHSAWIPDLRIGYHKNLVGSKISTAALGFSFFDVVTLDLEVALDDVEVDGDKAPRKVAFSLAFEEKF